MPDDPIGGNITLQIALIAGLILLNAFFAAAEIAIVSMRRTRIRQLAEEEGDPAARAVARLIDKPGRFLATIQVGVTLSGFFASAVGAVSLAILLATWLATVPVPFIAANAYGIAFVVVTVTLSFVMLVLGELAPKNIAILRSEAIALRVARPVEALSKLASPVVVVLSAATGLIVRLAGGSSESRFPPVTEAEILAMVATGEEEGVVAPTERKLIGEVFEFGDTITAEVMVPRVDVKALPRGATLADARRIVIDTGHTRIPVFDGNLDNIIGVIHAKDVLQHLAPEADRAQADREVTNIMRRPYHVPASKRVVELLPELQRQQIHLAVVVDEYGGTAGIVTLEDLLEELVGPIRDEYDAREEPDIQVLGDGEVVVSGGAHLGDVAAAVGAKLEAEGIDTVGGLIYAELGRIPSENDVVDLPGATVEVLSMRGRRVLKARVLRRQMDDGDGREE
jgi:putative hemolysin